MLIYVRRKQTVLREHVLLVVPPINISIDLFCSSVFLHLQNKSLMGFLTPLLETLLYKYLYILFHWHWLWQSTGGLQFFWFLQALNHKIGRSKTKSRSFIPVSFVNAPVQTSLVHLGGFFIFSTPPLLGTLQSVYALVV